MQKRTHLHIFPLHNMNQNVQGFMQKSYKNSQNLK